MKRFIQVAALALILFAIGETAARIYRSHTLANLPPVPSEAEGFGNLQAFIDYSRKLTYLRPNDIDYAPLTCTALKPNYSFKLKNIDFTTDSHGFRSHEVVMPKPRGVFRVFLLGGSTVEGGFNPEWTIAFHLEKELRREIPGAEVINAGVRGYTSQNELLLLTTKILNLDPDFVIVLDGVNDIGGAAMPGWQLGHGGGYDEERELLDTLVNHPSFFSFVSYSGKLIVKKSALLSEAFRLLFRRSAPHIFPPKTQVNPLGIEAYLNNLKRIGALLTGQNVPGIVAFQPTLAYGKAFLTQYEKETETYFKTIEKTDLIEVTGTAWPQVGQKVAALGSRGTVKCYDLSNLFRGFTKTAYVDSVHYTPEGDREIAKELCRIIRAHFKTIPCHPDPIRFSQGKLREGSMFNQILRSHSLPQNDMRKVLK